MLFVRYRQRDGAGTRSLASDVMHRDYQVGDGTSAGTEELAKNVAAVTYGGGSTRFARTSASNLTLPTPISTTAGADTVSATPPCFSANVLHADASQSFSTLQTFFLAMALYPEAQRKAQAELDAIIGPDRLPEFADQDSLPYIHAIVKECLRWQNVFTLGLPHRLMEDDEYKGYYIPKGSIVLGNVW